MIKTRSQGDYFTDDFVNEEAVETMFPAKTTLRMRMFYDICDMFDEQYTKNCPSQSLLTAETWVMHKEKLNPHHLDINQVRNPPDDSLELQEKFQLANGAPQVSSQRNGQWN